MMTYRSGLVWLQDDIRLDDNALVEKATAECQQLLFVYCVNPKWFQPNRYGLRSMGAARWRFRAAALTDLKQQLRQLGQDLLVVYQSPLQAIPELITRCGIEVIYSSQHAGFYEQSYARLLRQRYPFIQHQQLTTATLWEAAQLPFGLNDLPDTFSKFRRQIEKQDLRGQIPAPVSAPRQLPPLPASANALFAERKHALPPIEAPAHEYFQGGSRAAEQHVTDYFTSGAAHTYKETRNALDDWPASTKFSPWLADGSLSVRRLHQQLLQYEAAHGSNESTYWIFFELLWREYFHWYAQRHGQRLYAFAGIKRQRPQTSFYGSRWQQWCSGTTAHPIVNACMNQLNATGYMSNRGRQLVASCFVHELQLDWRYGAAFFEQQLIDYDVASNWGNWQYLAGVGADPRGHRRFDLDKQTRQYDAKHEFIERWHGNVSTPTDWVDAADWPISE